MTATAPASGTVSEDLAHRQLKNFFEQTRTLPQLLATLRSRRVGMGYQIEGGQGRPRPPDGSLRQMKGPAGVRIRASVVPLTEVEEAIVAWSACGPNGMAHWDIASTGGFHELVGIAGRTAAGPGNSFAHDLLVIKDEGAFLYNPGDERGRQERSRARRTTTEDPRLVPRRHAQDSSTGAPTSTGPCACPGHRSNAVRPLPVQRQPPGDDLVHPDYRPWLAVLQRHAEHL